MIDKLYPVIQEYLDLATNILEKSVEAHDLGNILEIENLLKTNLKQIEEYLSKVEKIKKITTKTKFS